MKFYVFFVSAFLIIGCGKSDNNLEQSNHQWNRIEVSVDTLAEMGSDSAAFFPIPRFVVTDSDNNIFVADVGRNKLLAFNENGEYLHDIGKRGPGPGEFRDILGMTINPKNQLIVFDRSSLTFKYFSNSGEYLNSARLEKTIHSTVEFEFLNKHKLLFYTIYNPNSKKK